LSYSFFGCKKNPQAETIDPRITLFLSIGLFDLPTVREGKSWRSGRSSDSRISLLPAPSHSRIFQNSGVWRFRPRSQRRARPVFTAFPIKL